MRKRKFAAGCRGFTLVELLVVIGIIALLISILIPVLARARDQANKTACLSNIRQIGIAFRMYAQNNKDWCPWGARLDNPGGVDLPADWIHWRSGISGQGLASSAIAPYLGGMGAALENVLRCPSDRLRERITSSTGNYAYSYSMNMYFEPRKGYYGSSQGDPVRLHTTRNASEKILLAEENEKTINDGFWAPADGALNDTGWVVNWDWLSIRHDNSKKESEPAVSGTGPISRLPNKDRRGVVCFADGHADYIARREAHHWTHLLPRL